MKKSISLLIVLLFLSSSLDANILQKKVIKNTLLPQKSLCATYAEWSATLAQEEGGSYWETYFGSYAYCIGEEFGLNP